MIIYRPIHIRINFTVQKKFVQDNSFPTVVFKTSHNDSPHVKSMYLLTVNLLFKTMNEPVPMTFSLVLKLFGRLWLYSLFFSILSVNSVVFSRVCKACYQQMRLGSGMFRNLFSEGSLQRKRMILYIPPTLLIASIIPLVVSRPKHPTFLHVVQPKFEFSMTSQVLYVCLFLHCKLHLLRALLRWIYKVTITLCTHYLLKNITYCLISLVQLLYPIKTQNISVFYSNVYKQSKRKQTLYL